ncbi:hypothetical protein [Micromonospora sp. DT47]|uniref:hypothetical protein n=1 Tax=Micromonospora sp. DT47 TaxID=3393431 RepID=UPI003CEB4406
MNSADHSTPSESTQAARHLMAYDDGEHGLAQRYLIQALRLAQASNSTALGAYVLAGMSDQANLLGHPARH